MRSWWWKCIYQLSRWTEWIELQCSDTLKGNCKHILIEENHFLSFVGQRKSNPVGITVTEGLESSWLSFTMSSLHLLTVALSSPLASASEITQDNTCYSSSRKTHSISTPWFTCHQMSSCRTTAEESSYKITLIIVTFLILRRVCCFF